MIPAAFVCRSSAETALVSSVSSVTRAVPFDVFVTLPTRPWAVTTGS